MSKIVENTTKNSKLIANLDIEIMRLYPRKQGFRNKQT